MSAYLKVGRNASNRSVLAIYADPSGRAAPRVLLNFGSLLKDLSERELSDILGRLDAVETIRPFLSRLHSEGFNNNPTIPLTAFVDGGVGALTDALAPHIARSD
jgi:hypothetical protein